MLMFRFKKAFRIVTAIAALITMNPQYGAAEAERSVQEKDIEARLEGALQRLATIQQSLENEIESIRKDLEAFRQARGVAAPSPSTSVSPSEAASPAQVPTSNKLSEFRERIINPDLGVGDREEDFFKRPTLFLQTRYLAGKLREVRINEGYEPNFDLNRLEFAMEGRVNERFGMGFEIQYHPATDGSSEELVNLAYLDFYLNPYTTVRAGQFIRPFGFDIQQSSFDRENPERMNAVGYFFPGQRDRGVLVQGNLNFLDAKPLQDMAYWVGVSNGNNFFDDNNANVNLNFRVRKYYRNKTLATGFSAIVGKQPFPPGLRGNNHGNVFGLDAQWQKAWFGLRGEYIAGNMPSTLLSLPFPEDIQYAPAFRPAGR